VDNSLATLLVSSASLVSFICFIVLIVQMFQRGATGVALLCIGLSLCCGLGGFVAFVYGWTKAAAWNINNLMLVWTVAFAIGVVGAGTMNPAPWERVRSALQHGAQP
jgi:hypothetical protein